MILFTEGHGACASHVINRVLRPLLSNTTDYSEMTSSPTQGQPLILHRRTRALWVKSLQFQRIMVIDTMHKQRRSSLVLGIILLYKPL